LIALMQDQVAALRQSGVRAAALNSSLDPSEQRRVERQIREGGLDLLYVAPERLIGEGFMRLLQYRPPALFAIDEAHCVSQWGHDFRPDYLQLARLHAEFPDVPRLALTATADAPTRRDIVERLDLTRGRVFVAGFDRPNIRYTVTVKDNPRRQLMALVRGAHPGDAGIVYCLSRNRVEETARFLVAQGLDAMPYHAGLPAETRSAHQTRFLREEGVVMVATIAFGMGIDKPNVRFVAHLDLPKSVEAYYQETGRAGRDGLPATAWLAYGMEDIAKLGSLLARGEGDARQKRIERQKLDAMLGYVEATGCRRRALLGYFGEKLAEPCGNCDTCLEPRETYDGTELARMALSAVYRTGQRFGAGHVIDVLRGRENERTERTGHRRLPLFGIGKDVPAGDWRAIFRQLAAQGLIAVDVEGHGGLGLAGEEVRQVLKGERQVRLSRAPAGRQAGGTDTTTRPGRSERSARPAERHFDDPATAELFEALRRARLATAKAQGVPPYVVLHDSTLLAIAEARPRDPAALAAMPGMGEKKLERYGRMLLDVLATHAGD
ncbi:MAG: DNA helicase RecQ, partial [Geminicoccaceae bacterium]|nr:DNA helicase RecQ [Geminicoccaceae bacterium]